MDKSSKIGLMLLSALMILVTLLSEAHARVTDEHSAESWTQSSNQSELPITLPKIRLLHTFAVNKKSLSDIAIELCSRTGVRVIVDKSVGTRVVSANFRDATLSEIVSALVTQNGLRARYLTNDILLLEEINAETRSYELEPTPELPDTSVNRTQSKPETDLLAVPPVNQLLVPPPPPVRHF